MSKFKEIYKKICLSLINIADPYKKHLGRPNKYEYSFYLKHIINVTINGLSWSKLGDILETNTDLIRKKYNKWKSLGIFSQAYNIIFKQYKHKYRRHKHESLFIDSTNIANFSGSLEFGYNIKCKNKKSLKITALVDTNKIPHLVDVSKGSIHDAKIMETIINSKLNDNIKPLNIVGDKGYIKNHTYVDKIKDENNITLVTHPRKNSKREHINTEYEEYLLKERTKVEHFFSLLKRGYKRISIINDKTINCYNTFLLISISLLSLRIIINLNN